MESGIICILLPLHLYILTIPKMKTKHIYLLAGIMLFFAGSVFVLHKVSSALQKKKEQYANLPDFRLSDLNGDTVSNTTIDRNQTTLFYFFDPDCSFCHEMLDGLSIRPNEFSGFQVLLITILPKGTIKDFFNEIDFRPSENIKILFDENAELISLLDIKGPPASFIYKDAMLVKRFDGPVTVKTLIKYLQ